MTSPSSQPAALRSQPFTIQYDATTVTHATQFIACAHAEQLVLECSSGLVSGDGMPTLPIHTRLSLPWTAAARLHELLGKALAEQAEHQGGSVETTAPVQATSARTAKLPRFEASHG